MKLILNTKDREKHTTVGNPSWVMRPNIEEFTQLKVSKMIIPDILYSFSNKTNSIIVNNITCSFPTNKRYSEMSDCISDMNASMAAIISSITNVSSIVFSFLENEGCLKITYTSTVPIQIKANPRLGISDDIVLVSGTGATYDFKNNFSLMNSKAVYVSTNNITTRDVRNTLEYGNVICCCPLSGGFGNISVMEDHDESSYITMEGNDVWSTISLSIYDGYGDLVNMRGEDIIIELILKR